MINVGGIQATIGLNTGPFTRGTRVVQGGIRRLSSAFVSLGGVATGVIGGVAAAQVARRSVTAFAQQETAVNNLGAALERVGRADLLPNFEQFASEIQQLTTIGDEVLIDAAAVAVNLGVPAEQLEDVSTAAVGLSRRIGVDLRTAFNLLGRASQGQTGSLARYGLVLQDGLNEQEKFNEVLKFGAEGFSLAAAEAQTFAGRQQQLRNAVGDVFEEVGRGITRLLGLEGGFQSLTAAAARFGARVRQFVDSAAFTGIAEGFQRSVGAVVGFGRQVARVFARLSEPIQNFITQAAGIVAFAAPFVAAFALAIPIFTGIAAAAASIATPVGAAVVAVVAVGAVLVRAFRQSEDFRNAVIGAANAVRIVLVGAFNLLRPIVTTLFSIVVRQFTFWADIIGRIAGLFGRLFGQTNIGFGDLISLARATGIAIAAAFEFSIGNAINLGQFLLDNYREIFRQLPLIVQASVESVFDIIAATFSAIVDSAGVVFDGIVANLQGEQFDIFPGIEQAFANRFRNIGQEIGQNFQQIDLPAPNIRTFNQILEDLNEQGGEIGFDISGLQNIAQQLREGFGQGAAGLAGGANELNQATDKLESTLIRFTGLRQRGLPTPVSVAGATTRAEQIRAQANARFAAATERLTQGVVNQANVLDEGGRLTFTAFGELNRNLVDRFDFAPVAEAQPLGLALAGAAPGVTLNQGAVQSFADAVAARGPVSIDTSNVERAIQAPLQAQAEAAMKASESAAKSTAEAERNEATLTEAVSLLTAIVDSLGDSAGDNLQALKDCVVDGQG